MTTLNYTKQHLDTQWGRGEITIHPFLKLFYREHTSFVLQQNATTTHAALRNLAKPPHPLASCWSSLILDFPRFSCKGSSSCSTRTIHAQEKLPFPLTSVDSPECKTQTRSRLHTRCDKAGIKPYFQLLKHGRLLTRGTEALAPLLFSQIPSASSSRAPVQRPRNSAPRRARHCSAARMTGGCSSTQVIREQK